VDLSYLSDYFDRRALALADMVGPVPVLYYRALRLSPEEARASWRWEAEFFGVPDYFPASGLALGLGEV